MSAESIPGVVAHAIQLAVTPVFLLTGLAGLLGVIATRLARVIDVSVPDRELRRQ